MADELRDSIVDPVDLVLYDEARRCLDGGAHRAAYVMSWIAAAEGILGKLRTMATLHAALGTFVGEFEAAQRAGSHRPRRRPRPGCPRRTDPREDRRGAVAFARR